MKRSAAILFAWTLAVHTASANEDACRALFAARHLADSKLSATWTTANPAERAPAFCEVTATLSPVQGSKIGVVYRLPDDWNGKVLGLGGGGWVGNTTLRSAAIGLARGYATMQTDTGHPIGAGFDTRWAIDERGKPNMIAIEDFGYRAVHEMTRLGKQVAAAYYGKPHQRAYWQGCSTGGRQGFMEVQRYPQDYDGVIAGAPVYDLLTTTGALLRYNNFASPQRKLSPGHLETINKAVLAACDANDGATDGIVIDPRACSWDPAALQCKADATGAECLTAEQVDAVRAAYAGVKLKNGEVAAYPLSRGSELGWQRFGSPAGGPPDDNASVGMIGLRPAFFGTADYDLSRFDADRDVKTVRSSELARTYEATNPDIAAFVKNGGKLLIWHGFYDPGPGPTGTIKYYEQAIRSTKVPGDVKQSMRLFLAPGVAHCGGGPGPDQIDFLSALESWVEQGKAPEQIMASKKDSELEWPVCAYPSLPRGDVRDGKNVYACRR